MAQRGALRQHKSHWIAGLRPPLRRESAFLRPWPKSQPWQELLLRTSWMADSVEQTCPPRYHRDTAHWEHSRRPNACAEVDATVQTAQTSETTAKKGRPRALESRLVQPGRDIATSWSAVDERSGCGRCRQHPRATPLQGGTHLQHTHTHTHTHGAAHHRAETSPGMLVIASSRNVEPGTPAFCASRQKLAQAEGVGCGGLQSRGQLPSEMPPLL